LLALDKFDSKKHSGIIAYFNQHYVNEGKIDKKYSKILISAQQFGNDSDCLDFYVVSNDEAYKQIEVGEDFISMIETNINTNFSK